MKEAGVSDEEYEEYQKQEQELEKNIEAKEDEISAKDDEIRDNESTISSNENYISSIDAQIEANEAALSSISSDDENASSKQADLNEKISNLNSEKQKIEQENADLEEKNKELEKEKEQLEADKQDLEKQKQELLTKTLNNSAGVQQKGGYVESLQLEQYDNEIANIRAEKDTKVSALKDEIQDLNVQLKDAKAAEERNNTLRENSPNDGQSIIDLAMSFEGKTQAEMREIMRNAGYQFDDGAWCADFVSFIAGQTIGEENLPDWYKNCNRAYCPDILANAKANGATVSVSEAQPGDAILFDWDGDGTADHIGYVVSVNDDGTVNTIEGNTTSNSQVASRKRNPGDIMTCVKLT